MSSQHDSHKERHEAEREVIRTPSSSSSSSSQSFSAAAADTSTSSSTSAIPSKYALAPSNPALSPYRDETDSQPFFGSDSGRDTPAWQQQHQQTDSRRSSRTGVPARPSFSSPVPGSNQQRISSALSFQSSGEMDHGPFGPNAIVASHAPSRANSAYFDVPEAPAAASSSTNAQSAAYPSYGAGFVVSSSRNSSNEGFHDSLRTMLPNGKNAKAQAAGGGGELYDLGEKGLAGSGSSSSLDGPMRAGGGGGGKGGRFAAGGLGSKISSTRRNRPRLFFGVLALIALVVIAAAVGGGVGGSKAASATDDPNSDDVATGGQAPTLGSPLVTNLEPPSGYLHAWDVAGMRTSWQDDAPYLSRSTLNSKVRISQNAVSLCAQSCDAAQLTFSEPCQSFQLVQFPAASNEGSVVCALYANVIAKANATVTTGAPTGLAEGTSRATAPTVVASYTFQRRQLRPAQTTPGSISAPVRPVPPPPQGADFMQFRACPAASNATVPLFANHLWAGTGTSAATSAVVIQHGIGRDFQNAWAGIYPTVNQDDTVLVAPNFYLPSDSPRMVGKNFNNWYDPLNNLAWADFQSWVGGDDPVGPQGGAAGGSRGAGAACSTYDVYDALLESFQNTTAYPNLKTVYWAGHSGGAAFLSRYAVLAQDPPPGFNMRYLTANAPSFLYFTPQRPVTPGNCAGYDEWMYGFAGNFTRYAKDRIRDQSPVSLFTRYITRDVVMLQGDLDTQARNPVGDYSCPVLANGGVNRRDRNYAYWTYKVLLAGANINVSTWPPYAVLQPLIQSLNLIRGPSGTAFNHRMCVIKNVGHDDRPMWGSDCGKAGLTPQGPTPQMVGVPATP